MERPSLGMAEVVGVAAAAAAAIGGLVVALSRAQGDSTPIPTPAASAAPISRVASAGVARTRDGARTVIDALAEGSPEIRDHIRQLWTQISDGARPAAERAAASLPTASDVRATGASVFERLQETVQETVIPSATEALQHVRERVEEGREIAEPPAGVLAVTSSKAQRAVDRSSHAAQAAVATSKSAAKETVAAAVWMTIAGALVFFVFLSDEQREKIKTAVADAIEQVQLLVRDFQGYEDEF